MSEYVNWISTEERLPSYGVPVLIVYDGIVQDETYFRDGSDDSGDWFDPFYYHQDDAYDGEFAISADQVSHWMPLPEPPEQPE